jgi:hypothetical protein
MTVETAIRCVGISHLLQPLVTPALSRMFGLDRAFSALPPIPRQMAYNMALAGVALPTALGIFIAYYAEDIVAGGPSRSIAWVTVVFWCCRLGRQCALAHLWPMTPRTMRWCQRMLVAIFVLQGPGLAALLALSRAASR